MRALLLLAAAAVVLGLGVVAPPAVATAETGPSIALSAEPQRLQVRQCTTAFVRLGITNTGDEPAYVDVTIAPQAPLRTSPQVSTYVPVDYTVRLNLEVYVPEGTVDATYRVRFRAEDSIDPGGRLTVPVDVTAPADRRCVPRSQQTVTTTSEQVENPASMALDGRSGSIWHTHFSPAPRSHLPQSITFGLGGAYDVAELSYLPRQDGNLNGTITAYTVLASADGETYTQVATGTWPGDATRKTATFSAPGARHLRLLATGGVADYASASEIVFYGTGSSTGSSTAS